MNVRKVGPVLDNVKSAIMFYPFLSMSAVSVILWLVGVIDLTDFKSPSYIIRIATLIKAIVIIRSLLNSLTG
jgi:hypothetical protein